MFRSPSQAGLPGINVMLADLPANYKQVARHLGITLQTLKKYVKADGAPRAVMLAIFWETRWGRSAAETEAANWGAIYYRQAKGFERQVEALKKQIATLELEISLGGHGAANSPIYQVG